MSAILSGIILPACIAGDAHAEFDKSGNYVCNPFNAGLETNIYTSTVNQINYRMDSYLSSHPNATLQQHDVILQDQKTWDLYSKSRQCIDSLGAEPDKVAPLSYKVSQAVAVPEFGQTVGMITVFSIVAIIVISKRVNQR